MSDVTGPSGPWSAPGAGAPTHPSPASPAPGPSDAPSRPGPVQRELVQAAGLFPLRPLGVGEIFSAAVGIYRRRPKLVFGVSAIVLGIAFVLNSVAAGIGVAPTAVQLQSVSQDPTESSGATEPLGTSLADMFATIGSSMVSGVITLIAMQLVLVVLTRVTLAEAVGSRADDASLRTSLRTHGPRAVLTAILVSLMGFAAFAVVSLIGGLPLLLVREAHWWTILPLPLFLVLGLLASLWVWARTMFSTPALVLEDTSVPGAVRRSFALTRGRRLWRALGIGVLLTGSYTLVQQVIGGVFGTVGMIIYGIILLSTQMAAIVPGMIILMVISMLGTYAASVVAVPFWASGLTALYADLRMRHESWDIALRRAQQDADGR
ncbi:glycerophosphodiester phosphodiesterase [Brachybacterium halotolerans subsp. kimchii]|uniref:glycerophosphodiester phosphodiesterase n=1 Tax=Brachybacterium halotolerans TaxID=2795215 RepID=UPI001E522C46|nr:glycerophosphodiester phosphodiesterase [Brachybacterium halotolerans]UEJ82600.1 glycerophosphodiester phosphodiesterase [Brachybacterium halotolerans subsp. kimchii]